jgi:hypothetical protein
MRNSAMIFETLNAKVYQDKIQSKTKTPLGTK